MCVFLFLQQLPVGAVGIEDDYSKVKDSILKRIGVSGPMEW